MIDAPSALNAARPSFEGFAVRRMAPPPVTGHFHTSPRQLKTATVPSGLSAGYRGRSTVPARALRAGTASARLETMAAGVFTGVSWGFPALLAAGKT